MVLLDVWSALAVIPLIVLQIVLHVVWPPPSSVAGLDFLRFSTGLQVGSLRHAPR